MGWFRRSLVPCPVVVRGEGVESDPLPPIRAGAKSWPARCGVLPFSRRPGRTPPALACI